MFSWLNLARALASLASAIIGYARDKSLMDAGGAEAALRGLQDAQDAIARSQAIRRGVRDLGDADRDDLLRKPEDRRPRQ